MIFIIALFIIFILFIPIPIKISFTYINDVAKLKIYFKEIILNKKDTIKKTKKDKFDFKKYMTKEKILFFHKKFKKVFKIHSLSITTEFGVGDPANTAKLFGVLNSCTFIIFEALNYLINIKNFSINFLPNINKKIVINETKSIFFISFAKIIYITLLFIYIFFTKSKLINFKEEFKWKTTQ